MWQNGITTTQTASLQREALANDCPRSSQKIKGNRGQQITENSRIEKDFDDVRQLSMTKPEITMQCMHPNNDRDRELQELRTRCSQLEKTVRWWSDCTNNWREKWSFVRDDRNQLREELRKTKLTLAVVQKQNEALLQSLDQQSSGLVEGKSNRFVADIPANATVELENSGSQLQCEEPVGREVRSCHWDHKQQNRSSACSSSPTSTTNCDSCSTTTSSSSTGTSTHPSRDISAGPSRHNFPTSKLWSL